MKKIIFILAILPVLFSTAAQTNVMSGPIAVYMPFTPFLADENNLKDITNWGFGAVISAETKYFAFDYDIVVNDPVKENLVLRNTFYINFKAPFFQYWAVSLGIGIRTQIFYGNNGLFWTLGGVKPPEVFSAIKNRPEILYHLINLKLSSRVYIKDFAQIELSYFINPDRLGKYRTEGTATEILNLGYVSAAVKIIY